MVITKEVLWEAVKEPIRLLVLSVIPLALVYLTSLPYEWAGTLILILRLIDKIIHEVGKETDNPALIRGLVRF